MIHYLRDNEYDEMWCNEDRGKRPPDFDSAVMLENVTCVECLTAVLNEGIKAGQILASIPRLWVPKEKAPAPGEGTEALVVDSQLELPGFR